MSTNGAVHAACSRGTFNGAAAEASPYLFAPCVLPVGHTTNCDAGPAPTDDAPP